MTNTKPTTEQEFENMISMGAHESEHDYRTIDNAMLNAQDVMELLNSKDVLMDAFPLNQVYHQHKIGECTACATGTAVEEARRDTVAVSRSWGYLIDCVYVKKGLFEGSSAFNALKTATNYGYPSMLMEEKYPLKKDGTYAEFIEHWKKTYDGKIPQEILDKAAKRKIPGFASVKLSPADLAKAINEGKLIVARHAVGSEWWRNAEDTFSTWDKRYILPLRRPKQVTSGHLVAHTGYDNLHEGKFIIKGRNSWGPEWGDNGNYWFYDEELKGYFTEAWVIKDIPAQIKQLVKDLPAAKDFKHNFRLQIQRGDVGEEVKKLQIALCITGHLNIFVEELGTYGPKTAKAVYAFQTANKVASADELNKLQGNNVGPATRKALNTLFNK